MNEEQLEAALEKEANLLCNILYNPNFCLEPGDTWSKDNILAQVKRVHELCESYLYVHKELSQ